MLTIFIFCRHSIRTWAFGLCILVSLPLTIRAQTTYLGDGVDQNLHPEAPQAAAVSISMGTGFVVDEGYILTAWHVVQQHARISVGPNSAGRWVQAEVIKSDPALDLALLKAPVNMPPLRFSPSAQVPIGLEITVLGYPLPRYQGMTRKITQGLVNGLQRQTQEATDSGFFQISAEISMGNSGGPVLAPDGSVIAMVQRKLQSNKVSQQTSDWPTNVNYALRSSAIIRFLQESPARPRLAPLSLNTNMRPYEIFQTLGPSVVAVIGRSAAKTIPSSNRDENPSGSNR